MQELAINVVLNKVLSFIFLTSSVKPFTYF